MAGKVIDLDPRKRITKEALDLMKQAVNDLDVNDIQSLVLISVPTRGRHSLQAFGLDFYAIGAAQTALYSLGQVILKEEFEGPDAE